MDSREQDKAFEKLLARSLRQRLEPGAEGCPSAEILAAYVERSLKDAETSHWELHFSGCARCQEVLLALAASEAELPKREAQAAAMRVAEQRAAARAAQQVGSKIEVPSILGGPQKKATAPHRYVSWRWLAPAAAAAAAVALWVAVRPTLRVAHQPAVIQAPAEPSNEIAQNQPPAPPPEQRPVENFAADQEAAKKTPAAEPPRAKARVATPEPAPSKGLSTDAVTREVAPPAGAPQDVVTKKKEDAERQFAAGRKEADKIASGQVMASEAAPAQMAATTGTAEKADEGKLAKAQPGTAAPAQPGRADTKRAEEEQARAANRQVPSNRTAILRSALADRSASNVISSPTGSVLWRVGPAGKIERSRDAGRTWQARQSNVTADLLAGAAPSETVCWVVGRAGTILRTSDGETWEPISSPAALDWVSVEARDALHATIATAEPRHYITNDGGKTWRRLLTR